MQAGWKESLPSSPLPPPSATEPALPPPQTDKECPTPKKVKARPPPLKKTFDSVDKWVNASVNLCVWIIDGRCIYTVYSVFVCVLDWKGVVRGVLWGTICRAARVSARGGFAVTDSAEPGHLTSCHSGELSPQEEELNRSHKALWDTLRLVSIEQFLWLPADNYWTSIVHYNFYFNIQPVENNAHFIYISHCVCLDLNLSPSCF